MSAPPPTPSGSAPSESAPVRRGRWPHGTIAAVADVVGLLLAAVAVWSFLIGRAAGCSGGAAGSPWPAQVERTECGWVARNLGVGALPTAAQPDLDEGADIILYAQLVSEETARLLRDRRTIAIFPENPRADWLLRELPGRTVATLPVVRSSARPRSASAHLASTSGDSSKSMQQCSQMVHASTI